jgi:phytoene/squalene synthetase
VVGYLLFAETHHAVDHATAEYEATGEETADTWTKDDWENGDSTRNFCQNSVLACFQSTYMQ